MSATEEPPPQGDPPNPGQAPGSGPGEPPPPPGQGYAPPGQGYAPPGQGYAPPGQGYAPPGQGYAPPGQGYAPPGQGYAPPGQGYAPPGQGYAPPGQGYGPPGQGYGPRPGYQPYALGPSGPRADFWTRFAAVLLDGLILYVPLLIIEVVIGLPIIIQYPLNFLVGISYFTYFEGSPSGQTVGKRVLGIRVVDFNTGGPIDYGRAAIRYVGSILSGIAIYIGYLWMLWDNEKQTWHDKFANAVVVPVSAYPVQSWPG